MLKREIVYAALAASLLTAGTAHAFETEGTDCMTTCSNTLGSAIIVISRSSGTSVVKGLTSCSSTTSGGTTTTTCVYSAA